MAFLSLDDCKKAEFYLVKPILGMLLQRMRPQTQRLGASNKHGVNHAAKPPKLTGVSMMSRLSRVTAGFLSIEGSEIRTACFLVVLRLQLDECVDAISTLRRWYQRLRQRGIEGLKPQRRSDRGQPRRSVQSGAVASSVAAGRFCQ